MKGKKVGFVILELFIILLGLTGITLAVNKIVLDKSNIGISAGDFYVDYKGDKEISINNLEPIDDSLINIDSHDNVIRIDFSVKSMKDDDDKNIIYDVIMSDMDIDCSLLNEYTKWNLYKNGSLLSSGNMSSEFDRNVYGDNLKLTNIQEDLPKANQSYDNYTFIMWISESCNDLSNCSLIDQSDIVNSNISFKVFVALYTGSKVENIRIPNYDKSCVGVPSLYDNMVPVYFKDGHTIRAKEDNSDRDNLWYDYNEKRWANSVIIKDNNSYSVGEMIPEDNILAYYVWIPRYSYKVWNINNEVNYQAYDAYNKGIDIKFDDGTVNCITDKCQGSNLDYYTHPAFNTAKGFWVSKYEMSDGIKFISGKSIYTSSDVNDFINKFKAISTTYRLGVNVNSSLIDNLEWGAILYLSHSKYGNMNISFNNDYVSGKNIGDTTTGNIYGVYDMSGSASEFVKANSSLGSATLEILLSNNTTWNNNYYDGDANGYYVRGGLQNGIYSYSTFNESSPLISARNILKEKSSS